jgi:methyltransferase (TIGR00027 family)
MRESGPSRTAAGAAFRRAAHQRIDHPPVFVDAIGERLLSAEAQEMLRRDPWRGNRGRALSSLRAFLAVRSRVAEDELASAVGRGVRQYVVLGAGLDTFSCRNPFPALRVFEVDHPATQEWKRERLARAGLAVTPGTTFVPVDFETQAVERELAVHGFDAAEPTAISWLGVLPYLDVATVWETLDWAAGVVGATGHLVFDYGSAPAWWQLGQRLALRRLARRVAHAGEPFRTLLAPAEVRAHLASAGFSAIIDLDAGALSDRYFDGRSDGLRVRGGGRVVIASAA